MKFDAAGKPAGFQLIAGFELDSPSTKSGAWAGVGAGVLLEWNGGINQSPIRKNNAGQLGVEINVNGQQQFMRVPGSTESSITTVGRSCRREVVKGTGDHCTRHRQERP